MPRGRSYTIPETKWAAIAKRHEQGEGAPALAKKYGVSPMTIYNIARRLKSETPKRKKANGEVRMPKTRAFKTHSKTAATSPGTMVQVRKTVDEMIATLIQLRTKLGS